MCCFLQTEQFRLFFITLLSSDSCFHSITVLAYSSMERESQKEREKEKGEAEVELCEVFVLGGNVGGKGL